MRKAILMIRLMALAAFGHDFECGVLVVRTIERLKRGVGRDAGIRGSGGMIVLGSQGAVTCCDRADLLHNLRLLIATVFGLIVLVLWS